VIEVAIFAAKTALIIFGICAIIILIAVLVAKAQQKPELQVEEVHHQFEDIRNQLQGIVLSKDELKKEKKLQKEASKKKEEQEPKSRCYVLHFKGDIKANQVDQLRKEITAVLQLATPKDEVVVNVESPGGVVHGYGLAASQLLRFREKGIPLTVCVDKVAASGGYMMACVANKILAAPFAILGSIGVVAQVPNFNRLLKKYDVDYKEYTAGEYKRTVSVLGEITPKGEQKFLEQLEDTHDLFKKFVGAHRPQVKLDEIATGEYWYGERAKAHGLIDVIQTSDDYLLSLFRADTPIYEIKYETHRPLSEKISDFLGTVVAKSLGKAVQAFENHRFF